MFIAGQRVATVLVYLTDIPQSCVGGCTHFPHLTSRKQQEGLRIVPVKGAACAWPNVSVNGMPLMETEHAAEPLQAGPKPDMRDAQLAKESTKTNRKEHWESHGGPATRETAALAKTQRRPVPWVASADLSGEARRRCRRCSPEDRVKSLDTRSTGAMGGLEKRSERCSQLDHV